MPVVVVAMRFIAETNLVTRHHVVCVFAVHREWKALTSQYAADAKIPNIRTDLVAMWTTTNIVRMAVGYVVIRQGLLITITAFARNFVIHARNAGVDLSAQAVMPS